MESLWQVDHTSLLNEVSLRYLWPLIDEIGYFLSQKSTFEGRAHSKLFKYQVVPRDAFFAPLENKQLLVLHCKAGAVPRWFSLCRFITTGRSDAHSNQRSTTRFTINFDVEEFRKHMSGEVNLHHHKYPHQFKNYLRGLPLWDSPFQKRSPRKYSRVTRCSQLADLGCCHACLPIVSRILFGEKKIWLVATQISF